ncbi:hypothetical protein GWK47_003542 [Chionoecetes opilio]|uniref:Caspase family p10 domain-containing protein n=1 Tax=Chionoecetes opilio TaxID=41210 RepID=A0A8J4YRK4_CHIOP|nr:hypothetical protein GWK47_003542 [Chionoecetes opilio]
MLGRWPGASSREFAVCGNHEAVRAGRRRRPHRLEHRGGIPQLYPAGAEPNRPPRSRDGVEGDFEIDGRSLGHAESPQSEYMKRLYRDYIQFEGLHPFADTLISHPTKWYDVATRCRNTGAPYISILVKELRRYSTKESIQEVLLRVQYNTYMLDMKPKKEVKPHRQAPYFESSLHSTGALAKRWK